MHWEAKDAQGRLSKISVTGVKDFDTLADDAAAALVFAWSLKDPLRLYSGARNKSAQWLDTEVNVDACLSICADLANEIKHGSNYRRGSRSGRFPKLGEIGLSIPGDALGSITVGDTWVNTVVAKPEDANYSLPILDREGRTIGDAFAILESVVKRWECLLHEIERGNEPSAAPGLEQ